MAKKEKRLSSVARELLEGARKRSASPEAAMDYLESVPPKKLNMYDRQKIGREILRRMDEADIGQMSRGEYIGKYSLKKPIHLQKAGEENFGRILSLISGGVTVTTHPKQEKNN